MIVCWKSASVALIHSKPSDMGLLLGHLSIPVCLACQLRCLM